MVRKFLFVFAALIVLVLAAAFTYRLWGDSLLRIALVPSTSFSAPAPRSAADYSQPGLWFEHGSIGALPLPDGSPKAQVRPKERQAAIFFLHPTSYIDRSRWNAPDGDKDADALARRFIRAEASALEDLGPLWAPRYRQATFGAFLTDKPEADRALNFAYGDIVAAFDAFLAANPKGPIILAGHSQGARHLMRLLAEKIRGTATASRIAVAYVVGWPISIKADSPRMGITFCQGSGTANCIVGWQSYAQPADPAYMLESFERSTGFTGRPRKGTRMLCVNPLIGTQGSAGPNLSLGMVKDSAEGDGLTFMRNGVGAGCDPRGLLLLHSAPDLGPYVLPGNNYHVYDYMLFWGNIRADAEGRLDQFLRR